MDYSSISLQSRVADFLSSFPPFSFLNRSSIMKLALDCKLRYLAPGEFVYRTGEPYADFIYLVQKGSVRISLIRPEAATEESETIAMYDEGDLFGADAVMAHRNYDSDAMAEEDVMLYVIPWNAFQIHLNSNIRVALFFASGFAAANHSRSKANSLPDLQKFTEREGRLQVFQVGETLVPKNSKILIKCSPGISIRQAAEIMTQNNAGSILIAGEADQPLGILTDTDLRKKVATGIVSIDLPVECIMSAPVITVLPEERAAEIVLQMMNRNVRHLCITEDGTVNTKAIGMISEHDILLLHGNNPAILVKEIKQATSTEQLKATRERANSLIHHYLDQEISITFVTEMNTEINDALIQRAIYLSLEKMNADGFKKPDVDYCWLSLGSEGRREQILLTDQDNAIVYGDPAPGDEVTTATYFLQLGRLVTDILMQCGYEKCRSDIMASNPSWSLPLSQWKKAFEDWIRSPVSGALLNATIFFDLRPVFGQADFAVELQRSIQSTIKQEDRFLPFLARNALENPPPLSFFRDLVVERSGEHRNQFDIKLRAMMPLIDSARLLALELGVTGVYSTHDRFIAIGKKDVKLKEICNEATEAIDLLMRMRANSGIRIGDSGRFIEPQAIGKIERLTLRNCFHVIHELQILLRVRYQLDRFGL
jgi:CBS domain-containing protein